MKTFYALEPHLDGTKLYQPGDKREADENDMKHLVDLKVLSDQPPRAKAESDAANKIDLKKATREQLRQIAAAESVTVSQGDQATDAELIAAIETKRKG